MQLFRILAAMSLLIVGITSGQSSADIYKITKADGSVVYTDNATAEQTSKIEVIPMPAVPPTIVQPSDNVKSYAQNNSTVNRSKDININDLRQSVLLGNVANDDKAAINYDVTILAPSTEQVYRKPAQSIDVKIGIQPALKTNDQVVVYLDNEEIANAMTATIATADLLPGVHTLRAKVVSQSIVSQAAPVEFYVIQNTLAIQNKRKLTQQLNDYYDLPWYQRLMLQMRRKKPSASQVIEKTPKVSTAFD